MWTESLADVPNDEILARIRYVAKRCDELDYHISKDFGAKNTLVPLIAKANMALKVLHKFWIPLRSTRSQEVDLPMRGAEALVAERYGWLLYAGFVGGSTWRNELTALLPWADDVVDWCHPSQRLFEILKDKNLLSNEQECYADSLNALMPDWKRRSGYIHSIARAY